jgi:hypothetical protein
MGVVKNVGYEMFPRQGDMAGQPVLVCFAYDPSHTVRGVMVRNDVEEPGVEIIQLEDGRYVLTTECQWQPLPEAHP